MASATEGNSAYAPLQQINTQWGLPPALLDISVPKHLCESQRFEILGYDWRQEVSEGGHL